MNNKRIVSELVKMAESLTKVGSAAADEPNEAPSDFARRRMDKTRRTNAIGRLVDFFDDLPNDQFDAMYEDSKVMNAAQGLVDAIGKMYG